MKNTFLSLALAALSSGAFAQTPPVFKQADIVPFPVAPPPAGTYASPWGYGSSAEWLTQGHEKFQPLMRDAGITLFRFCPDWNAIQPRHGEFNFTYSDTVIGEAYKNGIHVSGVFAYLAHWASADGSDRGFPIKDIQYWRDFVEGMVRRYPHITHWEVYNEFNSPSFARNGTPAMYAELAREAYIAAKKVRPDVQVGLSCANFAVPWFDAAIKAGAAGHFDFIAVHPYENIGEVVHGGEAGYLSMTKSLRDMLAANGADPDKIPLWITEVGVQAPVVPDAVKDRIQADIIVKTYVLSFAQGFEKVCWFEARGPNYGHGTDHGIIREDWTLRPAYAALGTLIKALGPFPVYAGWLAPGTDAYAFVFGAHVTAPPVIVAWAPPGRTIDVTFPEFLWMMDCDGKVQNVEKNTKITLTQSPVFLRSPDKQSPLLAQARANAKNPFPWGSDYSGAREVSVRLGLEDVENGIKLVQSNTQPDQVGVEPCRRPDFAAGDHGRYMQFRANPSFAGFNDNKLDITIVARCLPGKPTGFKISYESTTGYKDAPGGWKNIPADDKWHELTWSVDDASFIGAWGWNFRTDAIGAPHEVYVREVRVKKMR